MEKQQFPSEVSNEPTSNMPLENLAINAINSDEPNGSVGHVLATYDQPIISESSQIVLQRNVNKIQKSAQSSNGNKIIHIHMAPNSTINIS